MQNASVTMRQTITTSQVMELPQAARNFSSLLTLDTGVRPGAAQSGTFQFNGLAAGGSTITVDGTDAAGDAEQPLTSMYQNFNLINVISQEAIQEVQVSKGVMTAEIARTFGGNVNIVTKTGTNGFHGTLFENWQNDILNARYLFNPAPGLKAPIRFHQFGGSVGGPIARDKLFFFFVYEGYRQSNFQNLSGNVPTKEYRDLSVAFSPDGLRFTDWPHNPVLTDFNDIIDGCWDPIRRVYLAIYGLPSMPGDGYKGSTPNAKEGYRRLVGQSTSKDFLAWTPPRRIVAADPKEPGVWEFYGAKPYVYGNLYIAFLRILRDDVIPATGGSNEPVRQAGIGWTELMTSRDGENWTRYREPFIDREKRPGAFDHAMAWFGDWVTVGDQEYIYYCGYSEGHKIGMRQLALAKLRRNGFVSRRAGAGEGLLRTPMVALQGMDLTINARIDGELRVRVLGESGKALKGFDWSKPIQGDSLAHRVEWPGNFSSLKGKPVQLEFRLERGELYAFDLK